MNIKQIVALVGIIALAITLILPFFGKTEEGQNLNNSSPETGTVSTNSTTK